MNGAPLRCSPQEALTRLGVEVPPEILRLPLQEATRALDRWKDEGLKVAWKAAALAHHPDKNPGDEEEAARRFKAVQDAYAVLSDLRVVPARPPQPVFHAMTWHMNASTTTAATTMTGSSFSFTIRYG